MSNDTELGALLSARSTDLIDHLDVPTDLLSTVHSAHRRHRRYRLAGSALSAVVILAGAGITSAVVMHNAGRESKVGIAGQGTTYHNPRFGFSINVPAGFKTHGQQAADGDGNSWNSHDTHAVMLVSAVNNNNALTPAQDLGDLETHWTQEGGAVTFHSKSGGVVMVTGTEGNRVFYERDLVRSNVVTTVLWEYPIADKPTYDKQVTSTVRSFKAGPNRAG